MHFDDENKETVLIKFEKRCLNVDFGSSAGRSDDGVLFVKDFSHFEVVVRQDSFKNDLS